MSPNPLSLPQPRAGEAVLLRSRPAQLPAPAADASREGRDRVDGVGLWRLARAAAPNVVYFVPRTVTAQHVGDVLAESGQLELEGPQALLESKEVLALSGVTQGKVYEGQD